MGVGIWVCVAIGVASFVVSITATLAVLVRLPSTYFEDGHLPLFEGRPAWLRTLAKVGKNVVGGLLVLLGIILSVPGVPGQGILTILLGIVLLDIPGKRRLERKIVGIGAVRKSLDRLRRRFGRDPFVLEA
jgi:hypothetical protein